MWYNEMAQSLTGRWMCGREWPCSTEQIVVSFVLLTSFDLALLADEASRLVTDICVHKFRKQLRSLARYYK